MFPRSNRSANSVTDALAGRLPLSPDETQAMAPGSLWAKITGGSGGNQYDWEEIDESDTAAFDVGLSTGFAQKGTTATGDQTAYEINGRSDVPDNTRVRMWPAGDKSYYLFAYAPPGGSSLTSAEAVLPTDYTIVSISTWEDTGLTLTLPAAGTYFLFGQVTGWMYASAVVAGSPPNTGWLSARLYDATNSAAVPRSAAVVCSLSSVAQQFGTAAFSTVVTVTGSTTISLQGFADPGGGITFSTREIMNLVAGTEGSTHIGYLQIA